MDAHITQNQLFQKYNIRRIGDGYQHSFFGYYNKSNFDSTNRLLLAHRVPMMTGNLNGSEVAEVGYYDLHSQHFHKIGETTAWNWQMGAQLQWVGYQKKVIFNTRAITVAGPEHIFPDFRSNIVDIDSGESRELPLPIYVIAPNGRYALTVNYSRFMVTHRTIGYPATHQEPQLELAPSTDGIFYMNIETGETQLILSLNDLFNFQPLLSMDKAIHWVTHVELNPSGTRLLFIHRWTERITDETCFLHRLFTMNIDGSDLRLLECTDHPLPQLADDFDSDAVGTFDFEKSEHQISHPLWKTDEKIIVWGPHSGEIHYHLYDDITGDVAVIGRGILNENGHMSYSRDGRFILSDTYPDSQSNERYLFLFDTNTNTKYVLGAFYTDPDLGKHNRCDLHPRWSRNNRKVCIDSVHKNGRQLYVIDVHTLIV